MWGIRASGRAAVELAQRLVLCGGAAAAPRLPLPAPELQRQGQRCFSSEEEGKKLKPLGYFGWLREVFNRERIQARNESLKDELKRGYVNDLRELNSNKGKAFRAHEKLAAVQASYLFPKLDFVDTEGAPVEVPAGDGSVQVALVCVAFRNGAEEMLSSWREPFKAQFAGTPGAVVYEMSLVDSSVMGMWPFRQMILRGGALASAAAPKPALPTTTVFHFGDTRSARKMLGITNLLTGYVYLVDPQGRVRWRGCGTAEQWELEALLQGATELLTSTAKL
mmetsp:Transcript_16180/g.45087  ORF Transcript_16180/g.45087 Transcript_16180/m.45087 type:complete len:279 (+) Transcript_16180:129-965(+)|eukprot:CAMPEP_0117681344 /NCGR_PEP_ID=MMETSP0804-20121206/18922_1 /TAXON_ID=1074897 /ORGANISM="Tetraselmis astigmatica, Strain CCMP880" /LENGTH=278 /DNA_ID=CAMNT_0005491075 /DNA_START=57 /DNA_END=893 /DNA_ORIENTATION=-